MNKNTLILCPPFSDPGGVAYYYYLVKTHFHSEHMSLSFFHIGRDYTAHPDENRFIKSLRDLISLMKIIPSYDLVILNPSLDHRAIIRDGIFHFVAKNMFKKKTIVFFHGWIPETEVKIERYFQPFMRYLFKTDCLCVLARQFKATLVSWGFDSEKINVETTIYLQKKSITHKIPHTVVFLSRFVEGKGCLESIKSIELLIDRFPDIKLYMVGDGDLMPQLKAYVKNHDLEKHVMFTGYLKGDRKFQLLGECSIMLYPTNYGEGLPISILEGMGMGCIIISRPVGGIQDILTDGKNGFLIKSLDPSEFAQKIAFIFKNENFMKHMASESHHDAMEKFEISAVAKRLEKMYLKAAT